MCYKGCTKLVFASVWQLIAHYFGGECFGIVPQKTATVWYRYQLVEICSFLNRFMPCHMKVTCEMYDPWKCYQGNWHTNTSSLQSFLLKQSITESITTTGLDSQQDRHIMGAHSNSVLWPMYINSFTIILNSFNEWYGAPLAPNHYVKQW